ncbi:hypothetical protein HQQ80_10400 [Microbacteriaceae bacterium VKM Ac-2855]|nr:hypothetical protein [Microbacteriaceae bacterium VKM Ac-2855]
MSRAARSRARRWLLRYLPPEVLGTASALAAAATAFAAAGGAGPTALLAAAVAATIGENVGYYGVVAVRSFRRHYSALLAEPRRAIRASARTVRAILLEFGPAELVDSFLVRPLLFGLGPVLIGAPWIGWLVGKLAADVVFYAITITSYELGRRVIEPARNDSDPRLEAVT